jgi:hypothetical protein
MNFSFEFLDIHISHLAQFLMINMTLIPKGQLLKEY